MAQELFDGHVASEMSLGEAIVRGILPAPKYVLSIFKYKDDLEKYELRAKRAKSKATRDAAEEIIEQLRRALENAVGMDALFEDPDTEFHFIMYLRLGIINLARTRENHRVHRVKDLRTLKSHKT